MFLTFVPLFLSQPSTAISPCARFEREVGQLPSLWLTRRNEAQRPRASACVGTGASCKLTLSTSVIVLPDPARFSSMRSDILVHFASSQRARQFPRLSATSGPCALKATALCSIKRLPAGLAPFTKVGLRPTRLLVTPVHHRGTFFEFESSASGGGWGRRSHAVHAALDPIGRDDPRGTMAFGATLPLSHAGGASGSGGHADVCHEGGLHVAIGPSSTKRGVGDDSPRDALPKRARGERRHAGSVAAAVHPFHGEIALLGSDDGVHVFGDAFGRHWSLDVVSKSDDDLDTSSCLQSLRTRIVKNGTCTGGMISSAGPMASPSASPSVPEGRVRALFTLERATSFQALKRSVITALEGALRSRSARDVVLVSVSEGDLQRMVEDVRATDRVLHEFGFDAYRRRATSVRASGAPHGADGEDAMQSAGVVRLALLTCEIQFQATDIQWRPTDIRCLAVACNRGVCIWNLKLDHHTSKGPKSSLALDSVTHMTFLQCRGPVSCMAWSPCGRLLAVSTRKASAPLLVWDVASGVYTKFSSGFYRGAPHLLRYSPCGHYILVAMDSGSFFIWETSTWRFKQWSFKHAMVDAVWITGDVILASYEGVTTLRQIRFSQSAPSLNIHMMELELPGIQDGASANGKVGSPSPLSMSWHARSRNLLITLRPDAAEEANGKRAATRMLSPGDIEEHRRDGNITPGCYPGELAWHAKESRLAVGLRQTESPTVAMYAITSSPILSASLEGCIVVDS